MKALRGNPRLALAIAFLVTLVVVAISGERLAQIFSGAPNNGFGSLSAWWLRSTRQVVATTALIGVGSCFLGIPLGWMAAFGNRTFLFFFTKLSEVTVALPSLIFVGVLRVSQIIPPGLDLLVVLLALRSIEIGHSVRSLLLQQKTSELLTAARSLGGSRLHIFRYHLLPQLQRPVAAASATTAAIVVSLEAALSLVGLGLPESQPSWGTALGAPQTVSLTLAPALALVSLLMTTLALYIVGRNLRADRWIARRFT
jgi:peptide/nickel transport system permease protein